MRAEPFDLRSRVAAAPWQTVVAAFAAGAWLAYEQPRHPRTWLGRAVFTAIGGLTLGILRELTALGATEYARAWFEEAPPPKAQA